MVLQSVHLDQVVELNRRQYGSDFFVSSEYFNWRFFEGSSQSFMLGVFRDRLLTGTVGCIALPYKTRSETRKFGVIVSALVSRDCRHVLIRRSGKLMTLLGLLLSAAESEAKERGLSVLLTFPNKNSVGHFLSYGGYTHLGNLSMFIKALSPLSILAGLLTRGEGEKSQSNSTFRRSVSVSPPPNESEGITISSEITADHLDRLWSRDRSDCTKAVRDAAFYGHRFECYRQYSRAGAFMNGELLGYVVWIVERVPVRAWNRSFYCARIVDLFVPPAASFDSALRSLLRQVIIDARSHRASFIFATMQVQSSIERMLKKCGFSNISALPLVGRRSGLSIPVMGKQLDSFPLPRFAEWYLTMADDDIA